MAKYKTWTNKKTGKKYREGDHGKVGYYVSAKTNKAFHTEHYPVVYHKKK